MKKYVLLKVFQYIYFYYFSDAYVFGTQRCILFSMFNKYITSSTLFKAQINIKIQSIE